MARLDINTKAPDFMLPDLNGKVFQLSEYIGKKHVLVVFNRGFIWPFCQKHMAQLRQEFDLFSQRDTIIVVVGPENAANFQSYWEKNQLPFIGLPDEQKKVLNLYGQEVVFLKLGRMPAQMLIDKQGILRFAHYGNSMQDIPEGKELLDLLDDIQKES